MRCPLSVPWTGFLAPEVFRTGLRGRVVRAGLGRVHPHQARHNFATAVLDASGGNLTIARDAGGWASSATVDEIYGHTDIHAPQFDAALRKVWGEQ